jgi:hypothetical protein
MHDQAPQPPSPDYAAITSGIEAADAREDPIDDDTARRIAEIVPGSQDSAVRELASTGTIRWQRLHAELQAERDRRGVTDFERRMIGHLSTYAAIHGDREPVDGWGQPAEHAYYGTYLTRQTVAREYLYDAGVTDRLQELWSEIPERVRLYITFDEERFARDLPGFQVEEREDGGIDVYYAD